MSVKKYAVIDGTEVVNLILLEEGSDFTPPAGHLLIPAPNEISIGWNWIGDQWLASSEPSVPSQPVESPDVFTAKAEAAQELIDAGISEAAAYRIVGLPVES